MPEGAPSGDWRTDAQWWPAWDGSTDPIDYWRTSSELDPERYYAEQLLWYDRQLRRDDYVLGFGIFNFGCGNASAWCDFDIAGTRIPQYLLGQAPVTVTPPSASLTATPTSTAVTYPFMLQSGSPAYLPNFANQAGCNWMGIAGQVFDSIERPVIGYFVQITFGDTTWTVVTGSQPAYGEGGYEVMLGDQPAETRGVYHVTLLNAGGTPLSQPYAVDTFADCNRNLIQVNFVQQQP